MIKKIWIVLAVTCVLTIPVRFYQLMNFVDSKTGFFTDGNVTAAIVSGVLILGCAAVLFFARHKQSSEISFRDMSGFPSVLFGGLTGAILLITGVHQLTLIAAGDDTWYDELQQVVPVWVQHPVLYGVLSIFAVMAAVNFLVLAAGLAKGNNPYVSLPVAALIVPLWSCLDLTVMFVRYTEVVNTVESLYTMFMVIFLLLCLFAQARFFAGLDDAKSRSLMLAAGACYTILALTITVPNLMMYVMGRGEICSMSMESSVLYLIMALFLQSLSLKSIGFGKTAVAE